MQEKVKINQTQHVLVCGRNGTGKTYLARQYLATFPRVVALDTKGDLTWPEAGPDLVTITHLKDLPQFAGPKVKKFHVIYRPVYEELNAEYMEEFFKYLYQRQDVICWVDEAMSVCPNSYKIPEFYKAILTRGRSRKTAVWSLTQRPSFIPQVIISESTHFFIFDLNLPQDRAKIAEVTGAVEFYNKPSRPDPKAAYRKYAFWYYFINWEHATRGELIVKRG